MNRPSTEISHLERVSTRDGAAFSLMVGLGEAYVPAFVLALGLGESASGLITTLPLLLGAVLQLLAPHLVPILGSFRRWVVACALFQALSFLPLAYLALGNDANLPIIFLSVSLYWACGMSAGPVWNAWMARMIPRANREDFWGRRTWLSFVGAFIGFVVGGGVLHFYPDSNSGFLWLFLLAFGLRLLSMHFLRLHPERETKQARPSSMGSGLRYIFRGDSSEYVRFMFFMNFSVYVAAPFFAAFLLKELEVSYVEYVWVIGVSLCAKVFSMPLLVPWVRRHGTKKLMWLSGIGIAILPALWLVSQSIPYLVLLQLIAGVAWAGLELSFPLFLVNYVPAKERISVLSLYNLGRSLCLCVGSLVGAAVMEENGATYSAYAYLFGLSTGLRLLSLMVITRVPNLPMQRFRVFWRTTAVRPSLGTVSPPIVSDLEPDRSTKATQNDT